jgi:hypothetical protein
VVQGRSFPGSCCLDAPYQNPDESWGGAVSIFQCIAVWLHIALYSHSNRLLQSFFPIDYSSNAPMTMVIPMNAKTRAPTWLV